MKPFGAVAVLVANGCVPMHLAEYVVPVISSNRG